MRPLLSLALLTALTLSPSALALAQNAGAPAAGHEGQPSMLFISPSGEPFRGWPGDPYPVVAWFAQADANHDGKLDRDEFVADAMRFFARLDVNHNGRIDSDELAYYEHVMAPEILVQTSGRLEGAGIIRAAYLDQGMGGMGGGGGPGGDGVTGSMDPGASAPLDPDEKTLAQNHAMDGAAPYGLLGEPEPVAASDLSFTGAISIADFRRRASQRFDRLDVNKKGYLELATLPKTVAQTMESRAGRRRPPA